MFVWGIILKALLWFDRIRVHGLSDLFLMGHAMLSWYDNDKDDVVRIFLDVAVGWCFLALEDGF